MAELEQSRRVGMLQQTPRNRGILQYLIINYKKLRIDMQRVRGER